MLKLASNPLYKADVKPFIEAFDPDTIPYNEAIHGAMKSVLNSQMNDAVKIQAVLFINKYEITEDMEDFYTEVK